MEILKDTRQEELVLVNPNPERPYRDNRRGVRYNFEPMKKYLVPKMLAQELLINASHRVKDAKMQAASEFREWQRLKMHDNKAMQVMASKFCDENGETKTKPWTRPPLIDLGTKEGKEIYQAAVEEARAKNIPFEEDEMDTHSETREEAEIERPRQDWDKMKFINWITSDEMGGVAAPTEPVERLYSKAISLYEAKVKSFSKYGIKVVEPKQPNTPEVE